MKLIRIVQLIAVTALLLTGCSHLSSKPIGAETPAEAEARALQSREDAARILKVATSAAAEVALQKDLDNRRHIELAVAILETFLIGTDYSPDALTKALAPVFKEVRDPAIELAIKFAGESYQIAYGRHAKNRIAQNQTAFLFLQAIRDGAKDSLN